MVAALTAASATSTAPSAAASIASPTDRHPCLPVKAGMTGADLELATEEVRPPPGAARTKREAAAPSQPRQHAQTEAESARPLTRPTCPAAPLSQDLLTAGIDVPVHRRRLVMLAKEYSTNGVPTQLLEVRASRVGRSPAGRAPPSSLRPPSVRLPHVCCSGCTTLTPAHAAHPPPHAAHPAPRRSHRRRRSGGRPSSRVPPTFARRRAMAWRACGS